MRVAVTYRVCQGWRIPVFKRLSARFGPGDFKVFHGSSVAGTKLVNGTQFGGLEHEELRTLKFRIRSSGRDVPALLYPRIGNRLTQYGPDVLLCEGGSNILNNVLIYAWAARNNVPTVWWGLGEIPGRKHYGLSRVYQAVRRGLMKRSTVLLGYSSRATDYFERMGLSQPAFKAVNVVDTERVFDELREAGRHVSRTRQELGLSDRRVLLFVGAVEPEKKVENLLRAYDTLSREFGDIALVIVGDGSAIVDVKREAERLRLTDIHLVGRVVEGVGRYFELADVFVLPGLGGLAISEAMAHSLPIVCATADGCEVDLVRKQNGRIVGANDVAELTEGIRYVLADRGRCERMGDESKRIIQEQFNVNTYVDGIMSAISCAAQVANVKRHPGA